MSENIISDTSGEQLRANETVGSVWLGPTILGLALTLAQNYPIGSEFLGTDVRMTLTEGTVSSDIQGEITELDLFKQLNRVFDELLRSQVELDIEEKRVLYSNRWELYT